MSEMYPLKMWPDMAPHSLGLHSFRIVKGGLDTVLIEMEK